MADFSSFNQRSLDAQQAINYVNSIRNIYQVGKSLQALMQLYQSGSQPQFNAVVDALFTQPQRQEIGTVSNNLNAWLSDMETNHRSLAGLE